MKIEIDSASSTPPSEQLQDQLARLIVGGQLPPGHRLPAIRQLAADLGVAPGTVARAYSEIEREGLITTRRPQGSVVADLGRATERASSQLLGRLAERFAAQAQQLGVSRDDAVTALRAAYDGSA